MQVAITNKRQRLEGNNDHPQKTMFKRKHPSQTKDDNQKEVVINNKR
jgi:hypothetical protein